jgi:hypothetical protein
VQQDKSFAISTVQQALISTRIPLAQGHVEGRAPMVSGENYFEHN